MAQLKSLIVNGSSVLVGDVFTNVIQVDTIQAHTSSASTSYGPGSSGQALFTNGTIVYWNTVTVPTVVSQLSNDAGYLTLATLPTYDGTVV